MQIGISTACFYPEKTEDAVDIIFNMGFRRIEYFINSEYEYNTHFIAEQKKRLDALGIAVNSVHSYTTAFEHYLMFSEYPRRRSEGKRIFSDVVKTAAALGSKYLTFHGITKFLANVPDNVCINVYRELIDIAKKYNIIIAQENVSYCRSSDIAFLSLLKKEFSPNELMFTLDIKQAVRAGIDVYSYVETIAGRIANIHINDNNEAHPCLLPGYGTFNYEVFFSVLKNTGYSGNVIIEVYRQNFKKHSEVLKSKKFLENLITSFNS